MSSNPIRFGDVVKARRQALHLNQLEVGAAGGPSNTTMTKIEGGLLEDLSNATAKKLDRGLRWAEGSAFRVWKGGDPVELPDESAALARVREALARVEMRAADRRAIEAILESAVQDSEPSPNRERGAS